MTWNARVITARAGPLHEFNQFTDFTEISTTKMDLDLPYKVVSVANISGEIPLLSVNPLFSLYIYTQGTMSAPGIWPGIQQNLC